MEQIPLYVSGTLIVAVIATITFLYFAFNAAIPDKWDMNASMAITSIISWAFVVSILSFNGFTTDTSSYPPRLLYIAGPPFLAIFLLLIFKPTRLYLMKLPIATITYIHIVRVPVEIVLWWLAFYQTIPQSMTFEGFNYDIISGISAPFAAIFFLGLRSKSRIGALIWNVLALGLALNISYSGVMALPYFGSSAEQSTALLYFPYTLLPGLLVPIFVLCHLISILKLTSKQEEL